MTPDSAVDFDRPVLVLVVLSEPGDSIEGAMRTRLLTRREALEAGGIAAALGLLDSPGASADTQPYPVSESGEGVVTAIWTDVGESEFESIYQRLWASVSPRAYRSGAIRYDLTFDVSSRAGAVAATWLHSRDAREFYNYARVHPDVMLRPSALSIGRAPDERRPATPVGSLLM